MSRSINKVLLVGNVGRDPKFSRTGSGRAVAHVSLASNEWCRDRDGGKKRRYTEWHQLVFLGEQGEACSDSVKKGTQLCVEGALRSHVLENNGHKKKVTEILVRTFEIMGREKLLTPEFVKSGATAEDGGLPKAVNDDVYLDGVAEQT